MFDVSEAKEVFNIYTENWVEKVLTKEKWTEKKEMLETLIRALSIPKIKE